MVSTERVVSTKRTIGFLSNGIQNIKHHCIFNLQTELHFDTNQNHIFQKANTYAISENLMENEQVRNIVIHESNEHDKNFINTVKPWRTYTFTFQLDFLSQFVYVNADDVYFSDFMQVYISYGSKVVLVLWF